ncbi:MAG: hypothetical protein CMQ36_03165 [Gammaproteobacteria bacterium]|nr:hypothetical protein [Gammaproteobacteria bacterium]
MLGEVMSDGCRDNLATITCPQGDKKILIQGDKPRRFRNLADATRYLKKAGAQRVNFRQRSLDDETIPSHGLPHTTLLFQC